MGGGAMTPAEVCLHAPANPLIAARLTETMAELGTVATATAFLRLLTIYRIED